MPVSKIPVNWYFDHFGVNSTTLGLTTQDYLMRSQDSLFIPLAVVACLFTVYLFFRKILREFVLPRIDTRRRSLALGSAAVGLVLVGIGLISIVVVTPLNSFVALPGLCIGGGTALIVAAIRLRRTNQQIGESYADSLSAGEWGQCSFSSVSGCSGLTRTIQPPSNRTGNRTGRAVPGTTERVGLFSAEPWTFRARRRRARL